MPPPQMGQTQAQRRRIDCSNLMIIGERITIAKEPDGITAFIKTKKQIFLLLFLPFWLTGWTFGGFAAITALLRGHDSSAFLIFWLCGWFAGEVFAICAWFWTAFGREVVSIRKGFFIHKREVFGYGITKALPASELHNLRAAGFFGSLFSWGASMAQWGFSGGTAAVDSREGPYRFGIGLEENEAVALVNELKPYLTRPL